MLSIEIEYLSGVSFSSDSSNKSKSEWPPHPDRVFLSMVAAWGQSNQDSDEADALRWLESQAPPDILFPNVGKRDQFTSFVPVSSNTANSPGKGTKNYLRPPCMEVIPSIVRKPRYFPATILPDDENTVHMVWQDEPALSVRNSLQKLACKVVYIGHSSSLVRMNVVKTHLDHANRIVNDNDSDGVDQLFLRCPYEGRFDEIRDGFAHAAKVPTTHSIQWRPSQAPTHRYINPSLSAINNALSGTWIILACNGNIIPPLVSFPNVAKKMRDAIMSHIPDPIHHTISGHGQDGAPIQSPHMAIIPLANIGWGKYSDGALLGLATILPANVGYGTLGRKQLMKAISSMLQSKSKGVGILNLSTRIQIKLTRPHMNRRSLDPSRYIDPSTKWSSVTPVILDHHPKKNKSPEQIIADGCVRIGLPRPVRVKTSRYSNVAGAPPAFKTVKRHEGGWLPPKRGMLDNKYLCHAIIEFEEKVPGPVLIGAGRYYGLGLFITERDT